MAQAPRSASAAKARDVNLAVPSRATKAGEATLAVRSAGEVGAWDAHHLPHYLTNYLARQHTVPRASCPLSYLGVFALSAYFGVILE